MMLSEGLQVLAGAAQDATIAIAHRRSLSPVDVGGF